MGLTTASEAFEHASMGSGPGPRSTSARSRRAPCWTAPRRATPCSGTLLTNHWVITAAHCALDTTTPGNNAVSIGSQSSLGNYAVTHPSLDFALIRLATPLTMNGSTSGFHTPLYTGTTQSLSNQNVVCRSYGCNSSASESCSGFGTLREATLKVQSNGTDAYNFTVSANGRGQTVAPGDSGGGCFVSTAQGPTLAGIVKPATAARATWASPRTGATGRSPT